MSFVPKVSNTSPPAVERWRVLEDTQREADTMFAQYQLSQLLASGDALGTMADAVLEELVRNTDACAAALWLARPGGGALALVTAHPDATAPPNGDGRDAVGDTAVVPGAFPSAATAADWARAADWYGVTMEESRDLGANGLQREAIGFLAFDAGSGRRLSGDHVRFLSLVRHELSLALRAAQLREVLADERAMLSAILDGASDPIVAVDAERRVVRSNPAAAALLGIADAGGQLCSAVLHCQEPALVARRVPARPAALACGDRCPFDEVLAGAAPIAGRDRDVLGRDGPVPVSVSYARMPGDAAGAVGVLRDLRPSRELDELKSSFVAAVSHELRTPLALIGGYAQTMLHLELDGDRQRHYLAQIMSTTDRLTALVNQILEIARIDSDQLRLERQAVSIEALVRPVLAELHDPDAVPGIRLEVAADLPPVAADPEHLSQVLDNLVGNALKYAPGSAIVVRGRREDGEAVVSVVDGGPGIAIEERELVFERFFRGRSMSQPRMPGSGLGLFLCRRIVEAHGGRIWLDDVPRGTSVSFSLPLAAGIGTDDRVV